MAKQEEHRDDELENEEVEQEEEQEEEQQQAISAEEYKKLQQELEKLRGVVKDRNEEAKRHRLEAKKYKEIGLTPEEIEEIRRDKEEAERRKAEEKGQWDKLRAQLEKQKQEELQKRDQEVKSMQSTLEKYLIDGAAASAIGKYDGVSELLMPHIRMQTKVVKEDGNFKAVVVDENGDPQLNVQGDYKTIDELVKEMRESEVYGPAFRARQQSGGGSRPGTSSGGGNQAKPKPGKTRSEMNQKEQREWVKKFGSYEEFKKNVPWK